MNITRKWERVLAVGCSHGNLIDRRAAEAVLEFVERWKPKHRIHLGDAYDMTFLMSSKLKTGDAPSPQCDIKEGQRFLNEFRPTVFAIGNHEQRAFNLCKSNNTLVAEAAARMKQSMMDPLNKTGCKIIPYTVHDEGWHNLGGYKWGHGHLYGENFLRDTAETWGRAVVAHAHRPGVAKARRSDGATAYCVGTLADIGAMEYASGRRSTLSWGAAICFGEVCGDDAQLCLWEWTQGTTDFRLPI